jgi:hypothetical protein
MTTWARRKFLRRKTWAFFPVLFLLASVASDGFPDASKSNNGDMAPAVLEVPAQKDAPRTSPGDSEMKAVPKKQKEPSPPFEDFVPSEKIDADKAVDFPVDI